MQDNWQVRLMKRFVTECCICVNIEYVLKFGSECHLTVI